MDNKLVISSSPHIRDKDSTSLIMLNVVIALMPAVIASFIIFGLRALMMVAICTVSCVVFEYIYRVILGKNNTTRDLSAVVTGVILSLNLPVNLPFWMAIIGAFVAIVIVKQLFGGIGQNFANPVIVARVVLLVSFAGPMTSWLVPNIFDGKIELVAGATPLATGNGNWLDLLLGLKGGSLGEVSIVALLIGGLYLIYKKIITPTIPIAYIGTVFVFSWICGADPVFQILTGGLMLGAFFMATDYVTSPMTETGKLIFGIGCGVITVVIRLYAGYPEGVSFAILLMNILTPHIDRLVRFKAFGEISDGGFLEKITVKFTKKSTGQIIH